MPEKVSVADLINGDLLKPGTVVVLRTLEGVITNEGTIRAAGINGLGLMEYRTPTAWSRVVCKINSSGWRQIRLKDEKISLYVLKQKYIHRKGGDSKEDKPAKRQKITNKLHVPNTNHIPQQIQFITHPLQQQLSQQNHLIPLIVTPPKQVAFQADPNDNANTPALVAIPHSTVDTPVPTSNFMKFKLAPPTTKSKMLELLVYVEDPNSLPYSVTTGATSFQNLFCALLENFPQYRQKQFDIGVWSDQWGAFVRPPPNWEQFPSKTKVIVKTFPFRWNGREYELPNPNAQANEGAPNAEGNNAQNSPVNSNSQQQANAVQLLPQPVNIVGGTQGHAAPSSPGGNQGGVVETPPSVVTHLSLGGSPPPSPTYAETNPNPS